MYTQNLIVTTEMKLIRIMIWGNYITVCLQLKVIMIIEIMIIRCLMPTGSCLPQDLEREVSSHAQVTKENSLKNKKVIKLLELWTLWLKNMKK